MPLPRWVSLSLAKRLRHSCSTRSSRRNIFRKSSASRNDFQTLMKNSILFLSIICASGLTMVSIYNTIIDAQSWGSDIPTSIQTARDYFQHVDPRRFFTVAGPVNLILIVLTLILFWKDSVKIRAYFARSLALYAAIVILTLGYFVPRDLILFTSSIPDHIEEIRAPQPNGVT